MRDAEKTIGKEQDNKSEYICLSVGEPFYKPVPSQDGCLFDITEDGAALELYWRDISSQEANIIEKGKFKIGITVKSEVIFLTFKFEDLPWMDTAHTIHLCSKSTELEDVPDGIGYSLRIILVDIGTTNVRAMRLIGLSTKFSREFKRLNEIQRQSKFSKAAHSQAVANIYNLNSSEDLMKEAIIFDEFERIKD